jgi:hypothetical protein
VVRVLIRAWRRLNPEIAFGFLIATLFWIGTLGWQAAYAPPEVEKQKCYEAAQKSGHKSEECKTIWERTTSDPVAFFTFWLVVSTIGLGVSTLMLWGAGERQYKLLRRTSAVQSRDMQASVAVADKAATASVQSAKVAEDALFVAQRPYIFVTAAWFPEGLARETFDYTGPEIWPWIKFKLENHGRTPASIIAICADSACVNKLPPFPQYREQATYDTPRLIGADKEATVGYLFKTPIDGQVMNDIAIGRFMGGRRLFAFGYVKYRDIFDYTNTVGFCWYYNLDLKAFLPADEEGYTYRKSEPPNPT